MLCFSFCFTGTQRKFFKNDILFYDFHLSFRVVKLIKGILLGKPVGFLIIILVMEIIVVLFVNADHVNHKIK
jgi:hypothetical protein